MAEARDRSDWGRWSLLLSMTNNAHFTPRRRPADFDPYARGGRRGGRIPITATNIEDLKVLCKTTRKPTKGA
ncbi:MAG TPA: hypothetical protein VMW52_11895 [Phycisphaerae bacterium]|nr:hypothetical protein [Phycisphaerae bacterium]